MTVLRSLSSLLDFSFCYHCRTFFHSSQTSVKWDWSRIEDLIYGGLNAVALNSLEMMVTWIHCDESGWINSLQMMLVLLCPNERNSCHLCHDIAHPDSAHGLLRLLHPRTFWRRSFRQQVCAAQVGGSKNDAINQVFWVTRSEHFTRQMERHTVV